jgi:hypothetical protein
MKGSRRGATVKAYNNKQMGDACEMLVAAELTLHGVPALKVPDLWPGYDVIANPPNALPQRVSVKSRDSTKFVAFNPATFDWLAIVLLNEGSRRFFIIPKDVAVEHSYPRDFPTARGGPHGLLVSTILKTFEPYEDVEPTLGKQILDVSVAECEAQVEPDSMLDDNRRKAVATI